MATAAGDRQGSSHRAPHSRVAAIRQANTYEVVYRVASHEGQWKASEVRLAQRVAMLSHQATECSRASSEISASEMSVHFRQPELVKESAFDDRSPKWQ